MTVRVSKIEVENFKRNWPCSGLPNKAITFKFDSTGDLVDVWGTSSRNDGPALVALSEKAQSGKLGRRLGS